MTPRRIPGLLPALVCASAILAGCGDRPADAPAVAGTAQKPLLVAAIGDSITAGTPGWDPNPGVRANIDSDPRSQYEYWAQRRYPSVRFRNCGVNRELTEQIFVRLDRCVAGASAVVIQGGINDIAQGLPVSVPAANLEAMVARALRMRLRVAIAELLPWNNGYPAADAAIRELNRRIGLIARRHGVIVLPFYEVLEDPRAPGRMRRAWTAEGDHPSVAGYRRLGELAFRVP